MAILMTILINIMTKIFFPWTAQDALLSLAEQLLDVYELVLVRASGYSMFDSARSENWCSNSLKPQKINVRSNIVMDRAMSCLMLARLCLKKWCSNLLDARKIDARSNTIINVMNSNTKVIIYELLSKSIIMLPKIEKLIRLENIRIK